jgi:protein TonB
MKFKRQLRSSFSVISLSILLFSFAPKNVIRNVFTNKYSTDTLPKKDTTVKIFAKVEIEASFHGGESAWIMFLQKNLNSNVPVKKGAPVGNYTTIVQFVINTDGNVADIEPLTNFGYGMEEEVIRILKKSPRWVPAIQDGRNVRAYRKQPITFNVIEETKKKRRS